MRPLFRILGALEVEGGGPLGGPQQRALLRRLLLSANRVVSVDRLVDAVWGERAPKRARESLQVYVSHLRKAVPDGVARIRWEQGGYRIVVEDAELDALYFERLVARGRDLFAAGDALGAAAAFEEALALWRGGVEGDGAADPEIARLEEVRLTALEDRVEAELALGRHRELVPELEALVAQEPLRERLRQQLMLALYRSGRQADALAAYQDARRALVDELGLEPSAELRELEAAILRQDPRLTVEPAELRARRRLPAPPTPLIGRRREVDEVCALLGGEKRLVTLTGPGGTGKTRVAIQAAYDLAEQFTDGVAFVGLAALRDPELVLSEIATALEVSNGHDPRAALAGHLRERNELLVIDNFEQVDEAAPALTSLLADAPALKLLVTSRRPLRVYGEHEFPVAPLALDEEAVPLFLERAHAAGRSLQASEDVREICGRLDCLPLAIELVAARARELTLTEMRQMLTSRLELASRGPRDLPARQQTLRATIEWSYTLLDEHERLLFDRLGVFAGGCSAEGAAAVCDGDRETLASLVEKSLLVRQNGRFTMLETIREFAAARLAEREDAVETHERHARWLLALAQDADEILREGGGDQAAALARLETEHDNFRAALAWSAAADPELGLALAFALGYFWEFRGHVAEGQLLLDRALAEAPRADAGLRARALTRSGVLAQMRGDLDSAVARFQTAGDLATQNDDRVIVARSLRNLGNVAKERGEYQRAQELHEEALVIAEELGDRVGMSTSLINLADDSLARGDYEAAAAYGRESASVAREVRHDLSLGTALLNVGLAHLRLGAVADAAAAYDEALEICERLGYGEGAAYAFLGLAAIVADRGQHGDAALLLGAADRLIDDAGAVLEATERPLRDETVERLTRELGADVLARQLTAGAELSLGNAIRTARHLAAPIASEGITDRGRSADE
jgi:predicted ATPase/DNA-binding SARP family transcriptional activator